MRWLKHMVVSADDEKVSMLIDSCGLAGYGFFWRVLEIIAAQVDDSDRNYASYSKRAWCNKLSVNHQTWGKLMASCEQAGLFDVATDGQTITVKSNNILKYRDEWSRKKGRNSGVTPESLRSKESESEKEEEDKKKDSLSVSREERESCFAESESSDLKKPQPQNREPDHPEDHGFSNTEVGFAILSALKIDQTPWEMGHRSFARLQRWIDNHSLEEVLNFVNRNEALLMGKGDPFAYADTFIDREIAEATGKVHR